MTLKERASSLKRDIPAVFLALKAKETPALAKIMAFLTVAYALSPIDLVPDFIPVLGYLDDVLISEEAEFIPKKQQVQDKELYVAAEYKAVFELAVVDLTISTSCTDAEQSFIFTVTGTPSDPAYGTISLQVVLRGTDSITIKDLPVGTYSVSELGGWSWRQTENAATGSFELLEDKSFSFDFGSRNLIYWLSGCDYGKRKKGGR